MLKNLLKRLSSLSSLSANNINIIVTVTLFAVVLVKVLLTDL
jgi:hypothetical protein